MGRLNTIIRNSHATTWAEHIVEEMLSETFYILLQESRVIDINGFCLHVSFRNITERKLWFEGNK